MEWFLEGEGLELGSDQLGSDMAVGPGSGLDGA